MTVGSSYHFRKIVQEALLVEVTKTMELTSRSSTWTPDKLASDQGTWHQESGWVEIPKLKHDKMHPQRMQSS